MHIPILSGEAFDSGEALLQSGEGTSGSFPKHGDVGRPRALFRNGIGIGIGIAVGVGVGNGIGVGGALALDAADEVLLASLKAGMGVAIGQGVADVLVEAVDVELADEGGVVAVFEVVGHDIVCELIDIVYHKLLAVLTPRSHAFHRLVLRH